MLRRWANERDSETEGQKRTSELDRGFAKERVAVSSTLGWTLVNEGQRRRNGRPAIEKNDQRSDRRAESD